MSHGFHQIFKMIFILKRELLLFVGDDIKGFFVCLFDFFFFLSRIRFGFRKVPLVAV